MSFIGGEIQGQHRHALANQLFLELNLASDWIKIGIITIAFVALEVFDFIGNISDGITLTSIAIYNNLMPLWQSGS